MTANKGFYHRAAKEYLFAEGTVKIGTIDALTLSFKAGASHGYYDVLNEMASVLHDRGFVTRPWRAGGYEGWQLGSLRYGINSKMGERELMLVTGPLSAMVLSQVPTIGKATRVDFAMDIISTQSDVALREGVLACFEEYERLETQRYSMGLHRSRSGGLTLTRGKRGKGLYFRLYDKGAQMGLGSDWHWRYELEYKGNYAENARRGWLGAEDKTAYVSEVVHTYVDKRDLPSPMDYGLDACAVNISSLALFEPGLESKMHFLRKTVKPFLHKLQSYVTIDDIMRILEINKEY